MALKTTEIYSTTEYENFMVSGRNRKLKTKGKAFQNLEASIMLNKRLVNPIIVDENFTVVDGQHRLFICKKNNIPVDYIYRPGSLAMLASLNNDRKNWSLENYVNLFINQPSYKKLFEQRETTNLSYNALHALIKGVEINAYEFKTGKFSFAAKEEKTLNKTWPKVNELLKFVAEEKPSELKKLTKTRVISALGQFVNFVGFDMEIMKKGILDSVALPSVNTGSDAQTMLVNTYNKTLHTKNKNRLSATNFKKEKE